MAPMIRRYADTDHDAVYDICVRTAAAGGDARGMYRTDDLMPDLFAGPYVFLEPASAFVLDDGDRAVGYVIGTPDTAAFVRAHYQAMVIQDLAGTPPAAPSPPALIMGPATDPATMTTATAITMTTARLSPSKPFRNSGICSRQAMPR